MIVDLMNVPVKELVLLDSLATFYTWKKKKGMGEKSASKQKQQLRID